MTGICPRMVLSYLRTKTFDVFVGVGYSSEAEEVSLGGLRCCPKFEVVSSRMNRLKSF